MGGWGDGGREGRRGRYQAHQKFLSSRGKRGGVGAAGAELMIPQARARALLQGKRRGPGASCQRLPKGNAAAHRCSSRAGDHWVAAEEEPTAVAGVRGSDRQCARYTLSPASSTGREGASQMRPVSRHEGGALARRACSAAASSCRQRRQPRRQPAWGDCRRASKKQAGAGGSTRTRWCSRAAALHHSECSTSCPLRSCRPPTPRPPATHPC